MAKSTPRKPLRHFFIKRDLQVRLITKIVLSVLCATVVFAATLLVVYHVSYRSAAFYQITLGRGTPEIGDRLEIVSIILPSLLISAAVNVVLAFFVGLYSSRKYAVPIYKLEQWVGYLNSGNMCAMLRFREKDEMKDLSEACNRLAEKLHGKFTDIKKQIHLLEQKGQLSEEVANIKALLDTLELESGTIEVHTTYSELGDLRK